jgi:hypothetical protein
MLDQVILVSDNSQSPIIEILMSSGFFVTLCPSAKFNINSIEPNTLIVIDAPISISESQLGSNSIILSQPDLLRHLPTVGKVALDVMNQKVTMLSTHTGLQSGEYEVKSMASPPSDAQLLLVSKDSHHTMSPVYKVTVKSANVGVFLLLGNSMLTSTCLLALIRLVELPEPQTAKNHWFDKDGHPTKALSVEDYRSWVQDQIASKLLTKIVGSTAIIALIGGTILNATMSTLVDEKILSAAANAADKAVFENVYNSDTFNAAMKERATDMVEEFATLENMEKAVELQIAEEGFLISQLISHSISGLHKNNSVEKNIRTLNAIAQWGFADPDAQNAFFRTLNYEFGDDWRLRQIALSGLVAPKENTNLYIDRVIAALKKESKLSEVMLKSYLVALSGMEDDLLRHGKKYLRTNYDDSKLTNEVLIRAMAKVATKDAHAELVALLKNSVYQSSNSLIWNLLKETKFVFTSDDNIARKDSIIALANFSSSNISEKVSVIPLTIEPKLAAKNDPLAEFLKWIVFSIQEGRLHTVKNRLERLDTDNLVLDSYSQDLINAINSGNNDFIRLEGEYFGMDDFHQDVMEIGDLELVDLTVVFGSRTAFDSLLVKEDIEWISADVTDISIDAKWLLVNSWHNKFATSIANIGTDVGIANISTEDKILFTKSVFALLGQEKNRLSNQISRTIVLWATKENDISVILRQFLNNQQTLGNGQRLADAVLTRFVGPNEFERGIEKVIEKWVITVDKKEDTQLITSALRFKLKTATPLVKQQIWSVKTLYQLIQKNRDPKEYITSLFEVVKEITPWMEPQPELSLLDETSINLNLDKESFFKPTSPLFVSIDGGQGLVFLSDWKIPTQSTDEFIFVNADAILHAVPTDKDAKLSAYSVTEIADQTVTVTNAESFYSVPCIADSWLTLETYENINVDPVLTLLKMNGGLFDIIDYSDDAGDDYNAEIQLECNGAEQYVVIASILEESLDTPINFKLKLTYSEQAL